MTTATRSGDIHAVKSLIDFSQSAWPSDALLAPSVTRRPKPDARDRVHLVIAAYETGLVTPSA
jgi:hypothetical protein